MSKYAGNIITTGANAGYSVAFNGSTDYLTWSGSAVTTAFTFECWFYYTGTFASIAAFVGPGSAVTNALNLYINNSTQLTYDQYGVAGTSFTVPTMVANQWYHVAFVRNSSNQATVFLNGVRSSTGAVSITTAFANIGAIGYVSSAVPRYFSGYLSNVRYTTSAVYDPTQTTINVPTQLFNVTNTQLLTCNSPAIIDQSSNAFTLTVNGSAKVSTFTPFAGYQAYNPALGAATPGIWTVSDAMQAAATRQWNMYDPYFNLTTLKLGGNGPNSGNNSVFIDSSSNAFTISRTGTPTQGSFTPFSQTGWSNYFSGGTVANDYISSPITAIGTSNFTVEYWSYVVSHTGTGGEGGYFQISGTSGGLSTTYTVGLLSYRSGGYLTLNVAGTSISTTYTVPLNTWFHTAIVRNSNSISAYVNGVLVSTPTTISTNLTGAYLAIGGYYSTAYVCNAYISNFRVTNTAVYTSGFTPPTTPLGIASGGQNPPTSSQTYLLAAQSNRFLDVSTTGNAFTSTNTPSVQAFSPFQTNVAYTPAVQGGSGYFSGSGDYISCPSNSGAPFDFGTGNFTIEGWYYATGTGASATNNRNLWGISQGGGASQKIACYIDGTATVTVDVGGSTALATSSGYGNNNFPGRWVHVALVRSGTGSNQTVLYVNGVSAATGTVSTNFTSFTNPFNVGYFGEAVGSPWLGYITNFRVVKGTAVYTGAFTPPIGVLSTSGAASASAYSSTTNVNTSFAASATTLLCNLTNAAIVDSTGKNDLVTVGDAKISTVQNKYGGSSIAFDGTGDYLFMPSTATTRFGSSNWTIEFWFQTALPTTRQVIFSWNAISSGYAACNVNFLANGKIGLQISESGSAWKYDDTTTGLGSALSSNTWYHLAVTRIGATVTVYINGVSIGTYALTAATTSLMTNDTRNVIGINPDLTNQPFNGYVQDARVTTGYARYTGTFTPPTSLLQNQ